MAELTGPGARGASGATQTPNNSTQENGIVGRVKEQTTSQLNTQKNKATEGLGSVAQAVRGTTGRLREENHDTVARYVEQAADGIERFTERLKNKDIGELMNDAQRLARRKPAMFVGGAFAIGLLGARFMKSSSSDDDYEYDQYGRARDYSRGYDTSRQPMSTAYETRGASSPGTTATPTANRGARTATRNPDYPGTEGL